MRKFFKVALIILFAGFWFLGSLNAAELVSVGEVFVAGGSSLYNGDSSSNGGNFSCAYVPAVKFSDKVALLPGYYGNYRGSKSVYEIIGGGTLYQDSMSHNVTLRLINKISNTQKFKIKVGYLWNFFRETKDENWGDGLFDYEKFTAGVETEYKNIGGFEKLILSLDILKVKFPQYQTLATEKYGKEVYPGGNILDFSGVSLYFRGLRRIGAKAVADLSYSFMTQDFPDQNIINSDGSYSLNKRRDRKSLFNLVFSRAYGKETSAGISFSGAVVRSNQDHYSTDQPMEFKFTKKYYDYDSLSVGPVFSFGSRLKMSLAYKYGIKNYKGRLAQDSSGNYTSDKVKNKSNFVSLGISYGLSKSLKLKSSANYYKQSSNQDYEAVYEYSYNTWNFEAGIAYEF